MIRIPQCLECVTSLAEDVVGERKTVGSRLQHDRGGHEAVRGPPACEPPHRGRGDRMYRRRQERRERSRFALSEGGRRGGEKWPKNWRTDMAYIA